MRRAALLVFLVLAFPAAAAAQDPQPSPTPAPEPRIRAGVFAAGIDVGNLTVAEATARLQGALGPVFAKEVVVEVARKTFRLRPRRLGFTFDAERTAKRAYYAGESAPPPPPEGGGTPPAINVEAAVEFRRLPIRAWTRKIDKAVHVAPRNATVRITLRRILKRKSKPGRDLEARKLYEKVQAAFADPSHPRVIKVKRRRVEAKVKTKDLRRVYGTIITIDKSAFRLRLFKGLRVAKTYGVAVGAVGYPTPSGRFSITNKAVNPVWTAPNAPWAGEFAGQRVSGGSASNPLKARWLGIINGVGIHGTSAEYSIGTRASHGCIRMRVSDVIDLYPRVPVGTPVLIR